MDLLWYVYYMLGHVSTILHYYFFTLFFGHWGNLAVFPLYLL